MAYISADVYNKGIENTILKNKVVICLIKGFNATSGLAAGDILAFSEVREGSGSSVSSLEQEAINDEINKVGFFSSKTLTLNPIAYNRTKSNVTENSTAECFAIIPLKNDATLGSVVAYNDGKDKVFKGPTNIAAGLDLANVYLVGNLNTSVQINSASNFMFGGASITFSES